MLLKTNPQFEAMLRDCASPVRSTALAAQDNFALAIQGTLRQGLLVGDVVRNIYMQTPLGNNEYLEFPLDMLAPGEEDEYIAYTQPGTGRIPERHIEGDYVRIPYYRLGNSIDWDLKFAQQANYPVMNRIMEIYQAGFIKKTNDDGWAVLITAAADRNILIYDADAGAGQFTKRVISLSKVAMRRNGGGNTASLKRSKLTDVFCSPEAEEDIRAWGIDQVDDTTRREIYTAEDGSGTLTRVFGVNMHALDEFGEGQVYQQFYTDSLGASLQAADLELAIGLDLSNQDSFWMPIKEDVSVFNDELQHRRQRAGIYGFAAFGFGILDTRRVIAMSF